VEIVGRGVAPSAASPSVAVPSSLSFDLDLDSSYPSLATSTFVEGFESVLGNFQLQNIDVGIASNSASNGYRCQYNDPDYPSSNSFGDTECYLGLAAGQSPANAWHAHTSTQPDGGRAYLGNRSAHYGLHTAGQPALDTYGLSQMDALRLRNSAPVNLAARICEDDPSPNPRACSVDADCVPAGGGACVPANPVLSFHHQVSLLDSRCTGAAYGSTVDRAMVAAQVVGSSTWQKIYPFQNVYDSLGSDFFTNCQFDPIDDGSTEDDYFDPADPNRRYGPSSTCRPEYSFNYLGDTDEPFSSAAIGHGSDGPGKAGSVGTGTWVESKFDLSRFRGRAIVVRFLFTSIKISDLADVESVFSLNPSPCDDGWYVDDVRVTQTLGSTSTTVSIDGTDNSALPGAVDTDGDGRPDDFDCAPSDPAAFAIAPEVFYARMAGDKQTLGWEDSAAEYSGSGAVYDVLQGIVGEWPVGSGAGETCAAAGVVGSSATVAAIPPAGGGHYYLIRARNSCGAGSYGRESDGSVRTSAACP
jgi:hypothetical protein